jgi:hypothetical protein
VVDRKSYGRRQDEREDRRERERHQHLAAEDESQNQKRRHDQERRRIPDGIGCHRHSTAFLFNRPELLSDEEMASCELDSLAKLPAGGEASYQRQRDKLHRGDVAREPHRRVERRLLIRCACRDETLEE